MKPNHHSFAASFLAAVMHTPKKQNPVSTPSFLVTSQMIFAYSSSYSRKRTKMLYLEASPENKKSRVSRSLALGLDSQHQTKFLSLPPTSQKLAKSSDPRSLKECKRSHIL